MPSPIVTIVMPAFNVAAHLDRSIGSLQRQSHADWELIVVDDCSTDNTAAVLGALAKSDHRVRLVRQEVNGGPSVARNVGIRHARGQFIALLDADDAWDPERIARLLDVARSHDADIILDNLLFFDEHADCITGSAFELSDNVSELKFADVVNSERPGVAFRMGFLKPMFRTAYLRENALEYWPDVRLAEDFLLLCECLLAGGRSYLLGWPGYIYTTQVGGQSGQKASGTRTEQRYWDRILIADRLNDNAAVRENDEYIALVKNYRNWMYSSWKVTRLTALRSQSTFSAIVFTVLNPGVLAQYISGSKTFAKMTFKIRQRVLALASTVRRRGGHVGPHLGTRS